MGEEGQVIGCHTVQAWNEQVHKGKLSNKLVYIIINSSFFLSFFILSIYVSFRNFYIRSIFSVWDIIGVS